MVTHFQSAFIFGWDTQGVLSKVVDTHLVNQTWPSDMTQKCLDAWIVEKNPTSASLCRSCIGVPKGGLVLNGVASPPWIPLMAREGGGCLPIPLCRPLRCHHHETTSQLFCGCAASSLHGWLPGGGILLPFHRWTRWASSRLAAPGVHSRPAVLCGGFPAEWQLQTSRHTRADSWWGRS